MNNCLVGSVRVTKKTDPDKCKYSSYCIGFDSRSEFSFTDASIGRDIITFGAHMSSSIHVDNKNTNILILGKKIKQGLDDTRLTAEAIYLINFT